MTIRPECRRFPRAAALVLMALLIGACKKSAPTAPPPATGAREIDPSTRIAMARDEIVHAEDALTKRYLELDKRRARLAKASPAEVQTYNLDAAAYAADVEALRRRAEAVRQLQAGPAGLRPPAAPQLEQQAQECLGRLRAAVNIGDWSAQATAMEQALAQYRQTQAFAQISALAQSRLAAVTLADIEKSLRAKAADSGGSRESPTNMNILIQELRAVINQPVKTIAKLDAGVRTVDFHPGGTPLDYERVTREELSRERRTFEYPQVEPASHRGVFYRGEDIEFNLLLKFYYADPTYPTKRLSDSEYEKIIEICRRIANATKGSATGPAAPVSPAANSVSVEKLWPRVETLKRTWPR